MALNKKASFAAAVLIIIAIVLVALVAFVYLAFTPMVEKIENKTINKITEPDRLETVTKIKSAWTNWPGISILAIILMLIVGVIKYSGRNQYQG